MQLDEEGIRFIRYVHEVAKFAAHNTTTMDVEKYLLNDAWVEDVAELFLTGFSTSEAAEKM